MLGSTAGLVADQAVDPDDGDPIWDFAAGDEPFPGILVVGSRSARAIGARPGWSGCARGGTRPC